MFNPLDHIDFDSPTKTVSESASAEPKVSESSLDFASEFQCPKCNAPFEKATAAKGLIVNYCPKCRVATPLRDQD